MTMQEASFSRSAILLATVSLCVGLALPLPLRAQTLLEALADAYESNPTLRASRAELRGVNEGVPQALSNWRPTVTFTADAGLQSNETDLGEDQNSRTESSVPRQVALSVTQPLYRGGRSQAELEQSESLVQAQRALLWSTEQDVLLSAVAAFMDAWRDEAILRLNINNEQVLARQLEASRDRFQVGEITRTDVAQAESRLSGATAERIAAEGALSGSRAIYEEVIGSPPVDLKAPNPLEGLPVSLQFAVDQAARENPNVLSALYVERAADRQVRQVLGELLPQVDLVGRLSRDDDQTRKDTSTEQAEVSAQLTVPLYQAGFVSSRVREAKQVNSQRKLEMEQERRTAIQNAVSSWEELQTARAQIRSFESQVNAADIALEGVRQENLVGARTVLDVLDAEQELLDAQVSLVGAQRDEIVAGFRVLSSVGRLTAVELALPVDIYDPGADYDAIRETWFGLQAPGVVE